MMQTEKDVLINQLKEKANFKPARFLDPKTDVVFKKIFGQNPDLIKSFLNAVLPLQEDQLIDSLEYLSPEQSPRIPTMKNTIVDVKCKDKQGRVFLVEIQLNWSASFKNRLQCGVSKALVQQLTKGEDYHSLCPVYGLGIVNDRFDTSEDWFHYYRTVKVGKPEEVLPGLELIFLELPKFKPQTFAHRKMGVLWLRFLNEMNDKVREVPEEFLKNPDLAKAMEMAQESGYTPEELDAYDRYWDAVQVEKAVIGNAVRKGIEEGAQKKEKELIQGMLSEGIDIQVIAKITGFSQESLNDLTP